MILSTADLAKTINTAVFPGQQGGPLEHVVAAEGLRPSDHRYASSPTAAGTLEGAGTLAERLSAEDVRKAGVAVLSGGTDVHLVLVDLRDSEL